MTSLQRSVSAEELSKQEFEELLKEEQFLDFFNKYTSLPVFAQLVVRDKKQNFTFEPGFNDKFTLNESGLMEWLWKKRCCHFVKTRFYINYKLARLILSYTLHRNDFYDFEDLDQTLVSESLNWMMKKHFGKASAFRKFYYFLRKRIDGYRLYLFWVVAERVFQYIERESISSLQKFNKIRNKFFSGFGSLSFPKHDLESVWKHTVTSYPTPPPEANKSKFYAIVFTIQMQEFCIKRLCTYWIPRYLLSKKILNLTYEEEGYYQIAMDYLNRSLEISIQTLKSNPDVRESLTRFSETSFGVFASLSDLDDKKFSKQSLFRLTGANALKSTISLQDKASLYEKALQNSLLERKPEEVPDSQTAEIVYSESKSSEEESEEKKYSEKTSSADNDSLVADDIDDETSSDEESKNSVAEEKQDLTENDSSTEKDDEEKEVDNTTETKDISSDQEDDEKRPDDRVVLDATLALKKLAGTSIQNLSVSTYSKDVTKKKDSSNKTKPNLESKLVTTLTFTLSQQKEKVSETPYWKRMFLKRRKAAAAAAEALKATNQSTKKKKRTKNTVEQLRKSSPNDLRFDFGTSFTLEEDYVTRGKVSQKRIVAAFQTDHAAGNPFRQFLSKTKYADNLNNLCFWQDVEKCRVDYNFGTMEFDDFLKAIKSIASTYLLSNCTTPINIPATIKKEVVLEIFSNNVIEIPWKLRRIQMIIFDELQECFDSYQKQDYRIFYDTVANPNNDGYIIPEVQNLFPFQNAEKLPKKNSLAGLGDAIPTQKKQYDQDNYSVKSFVNDEMVARMYRAQKMVLETHLPRGRIVTMSDVDSESSDEEGRVKSPPPPKQVIKEPVDYKSLAALSAREYPNDSCPYITIRTIQKRIISDAGFYGRRKSGVGMKKTLFRPCSNITIALKDPDHFEAFQRFLKTFNMDAPLNFWLAVENIKPIGSQKVRQIRANNIMRKFFQNRRRPPEKFLNCNADIITNIARARSVTTAMLYQAQKAVAKSLENGWFRKYASTFPEEITQKSNYYLNPISAKPITITTEKTKRAWTKFFDIMRSAASFVRCMKQQKFVDLFTKFLKSEMSEFKKNNILKGLLKAEFDPSMFMKVRENRSEAQKRAFNRCVVNGNTVVISLLRNDFTFWREIECYKRIADYCRTERTIVKNERAEEWKILKRKAFLISKCYLNSNILPVIRVNLNSEIRDKILSSFQTGFFGRSVFHRAVLQIFPILLNFWKRFCKEYYQYSPVLAPKYKKIYGLKRTPAIAAALKEKRKAKKSEKLKPLKVVTKETKSNLDLPDFFKITPQSINRMKGFLRASDDGEDDYESRLSFSIMSGVTLIQSLSLPIKYRPSETANSMNTITFTEKPHSDSNNYRHSHVHQKTSISSSPTRDHVITKQQSRKILHVVD